MVYKIIASKTICLPTRKQKYKLNHVFSSYLGVFKIGKHPMANDAPRTRPTPHRLVNILNERRTPNSLLAPTLRYPDRCNFRRARTDTRPATVNLSRLNHFRINSFISNNRYEIRTNPSFFETPSTEHLYSSPASCRQSSSHWSGVFPIETGDSCPVNQYYYSGFVALQALLDYTKIRVRIFLRNRFF